MIYEFKFPDVGEGVHEGKVLQLKFNPGDKVSAGDILAIIETDKVVAEIPSSKTGTLQKYGISEGQIIEVGKTLAFIELEGSKTETKPQTKDDEAGVVGQLESAGNFVMPASGEGQSDMDSQSVSLSSQSKKILATPLARKLAQNQGLDLSLVEGTGPAGRITKDDVVNFKIVKPAPQEENKLSAPLSTMRKTIAKNMEESHAIPTATLHELSTIDALKDLREVYNQKAKERLSYLPFFIKIVGISLKKFPQFNATYDVNKGEVSLKKEINIGVAVEAPKGLMVPVIKNVESKSILEIHEELKNLIAKAKDGTIGLEDLRGGTFTLTNYGSFGGIFGNPLILPPQVAILGLGRIHEAPVVKEGALAVGTVLPLSFVFDHRVIDGALAGQFISFMRERLTHPEKLLLEMN